MEGIPQYRTQALSWRAHRGRPSGCRRPNTPHAVVQPRFEAWGGLILGDAGTVLSVYDTRWKSFVLCVGTGHFASNAITVAPARYIGELTHLSHEEWLPVSHAETMAHMDLKMQLSPAFPRISALPSTISIPFCFSSGSDSRNSGEHTEPP
ncbi:hypothetical protein B0H12DRAFT_382707 [Mycena haematopus]|nr:hypothetical protein B0H12DRAFT_382707 [Mycena haematopus]